MNELFLLLLITFTLITFIRFNKKLGVAAIIPGTFASNREAMNAIENFSNATYDHNNNLWSATVTDKSSNCSLLVYHPYHPATKLHAEKLKKTHTQRITINASIEYRFE